MQEKNLKLKVSRIGPMPMILQILDKLDLRSKLLVALKNEDYVDAILILLSNVLIDREALYAVKEWARTYGLRLSSGTEVNDDRIGRALDRLFEADRSTLQTQVTLSLIKKFNLKMDQIHSDTTSVSVSGNYENQNKKAIQLKRGHSKDHRPDLKQLIYNLCVTNDGAVPVHFKSYDGNQSDDSIQLETWNNLRSLLQRPDFIYVGDSKLCVERTLRKIDAEHGLFVTVVPRTRSEVKEFSKELSNGDVRWQRILRKKSRTSGEFDTFDVALGHHQLREGFSVFWYRSSQKKKRDAFERKDRIARATERLENLNLKRLRGPKTEAAIKKKIDAIISRFAVQAWITVDTKIDITEKFKALTRGKPTKETKYRCIKIKTPRLHIKKNAEAIAHSQMMDGLFPLATNTKKNSLDVLQIYKYQPKIEKRHAFLKSTLNVAPVWLKKNTRVEALMFVEYLAQMVAAIIERNLRLAMKTAGIKNIHSLPEGRSSETPTFEQLHRIFENRQRQELYENNVAIKLFSEPLSLVQSQILYFLEVAESEYLA
ncbi:MAG: IS1634 family transposase [Bacteriovoracaceae bacterium]|nr:IS1634 family transposase [Bacteriovoracaceae bacterium]